MLNILLFYYLLYLVKYINPFVEVKDQLVDLNKTFQFQMQLIETLCVFIVYFQPLKPYIMKQFKTVMLAVVMLFSFSYVNAEIDPVKKATKELQSQLAQIINSNSFLKTIDSEQTIKISFMVNKSSEIVVLTTDNEELDSTMKNLLNYKKLNIDPSLVNQVFCLPVTINK